MANENILDQGISERGATGQRELIPANTYTGCEISSIESLELTQKDAENNNEARLKFTFVCQTMAGKPSFDRYINVKKGKALNPHPTSTHFKLLSALWPSIPDRIGKTFRDMIGEQVNVNVFHVTNDQGILAEEVVYSPYTAPEKEEKAD